MAEGEESVRVGPGYPLDQLARAFVTALTHDDEQTRRGAETRFEKWEAVLRGMASGKLRIGSREPVTGLPAWVTPEVVRGGFATGEPAAGGPLTAAETAQAAEAGLPASREALFAWFLTEPGLRALSDALSTSNYRVGLPEEAALLVAAWLGRAGDEAAALALVSELAPFADRLRFMPTPSPDPLGDIALVSRETVGDVAEALRRRRENDRVETMREALEVWAPYADELLMLFLETVEDGRVSTHFNPEWLQRAKESLDRYRGLAVLHTRCSKHRRPKENLAILRTAAEALVEGRDLTDRKRGLLQHAVDSMVARRGAPGSDRHAALRALQARDAAQPSHKRLADLTASRLSYLPQDRGTSEIDLLVREVTPKEAPARKLPEGTPIPSAIRRVVIRASEGTVESLIERGVVPSSEVLARLVPQIAAQAVADRFPDPELGRLMAAHYLAFRRRRSLLLLDLEHQVRVDELPWVRAVASYRRADESSREALLALQRLGELAVDGFPATIFPNPLIRELDALARESRLKVPFVEELAADIFMGTFSAKFLAAAQLAGELLRGSLYERYYDIDYEQLRLMAPDRPDKGSSARTSAFAALCHSRSEAPSGWSVAANGMVIEQAQILTTHNLAALAGPIGLRHHFERKSDTLAARSLDRVLELIAKTSGNPRPLGTVKDAAYAWRQMIFYLSFAAPSDYPRFLDQIASRLAAQPSHVSEKLASAVGGLDWVMRGGSLDDTSAPGDARRFLGWAAGGHWMLPRRRQDIQADEVSG